MMPFGVSLKWLRTSSVIFRIVDPAGAECVDHHRDRIGHADRVGKLHLQLFGEAGRDEFFAMYRAM